MAVKSLETVQTLAVKNQSVFSVPDFESDPKAVRATAKAVRAEVNAGYDAVGSLKPSEVTFENTIQALSEINSAAGSLLSKLWLMKETFSDAALRKASTDTLKRLEEWLVGLAYREDVFKAIKALEKKKPKLTGEDKKLYEEVLRDYRRAGMYLPKKKRDEVEALRKELSKLETDFDTHITKAKKALTFTREELAGVPDVFLNDPEIKVGEDKYRIMANITWHALSVLDNADREATRSALYFARSELARTENEAILNRMVALRREIAHKLGYETWADYRTETKMAKNGQAPVRFLNRMRRGLKAKFKEEIETLRALKVEDTGDPKAKIEMWDYRYYSTQLNKKKYNVDKEKLRAFFPYQPVLTGMFEIYQTLFGVTFSRVEPPFKWVDDLQFFVVTDTKTGEVLGGFYLDMFPREGKYNHFAQFPVISGRVRADGTYQRPIVALVCNFPPPRKNRPSLLTHDDVNTLFHEFGHCMHSMLTRAKYGRFSGTSVPGDFVEAPSQMLEYWVWEKDILDGFAGHYRNRSKKIPKEILDQMEEARKALAGIYYLRQISFGLLDLTLHGTKGNASIDAVAVSNEVLSDVFLPVGEGTSMATYFGHLAGYDAGYYGYMWAEAIAADFATVFREAKKGFMDTDVGMRLRKEIYEPGDSRDVTISVRKFLGREQSIEPYLKRLGIE